MSGIIDGAEAGYHFSLAYLLICLVLVPLQCIAEEYVFRGLFMQTFGSWFNNPILAVVLQSIIFTALHGYNIYGIMEIFISGLFYGFFTLKTNGIEVSSALHTANNLSIFVLVMFGLQSAYLVPMLNNFTSSIIFEALLFTAMYYIGKKTCWFNEITNLPENTGTC